MRVLLVACIVAGSTWLTGCAKDEDPKPEAEPTNPNVSVQLDRGEVTLLAARDRIRFPEVTADGPAGSASPPLSFVVTNTGTETMRVYRVVKSSGDGADFVISTAGMATSLAPAASTQFTVAFDPLTVGAKGATILVVTNAAIDNRYELVVSGMARPIPVNAADTSTHAFTAKTTGDLTAMARSVIAGNVRPTGGPRLLIGSGQNPGANQGSRMTVFARTEGGGPFDYTFEAEKVFTTGAMDMFEPLLAHDFDGDGVDEIFGKLNQSPVFVRWSAGDYVVCWTTESALISMEYGVALADVDRDGRDELLVGSSSQTRIFSWDAGFAGFTPDATLTGGSGMNVGVGDIDGDGFLEIATAVEGSGDDVYVYRFDGVGYAQLYAGTGLSTIGYVGFTAADLDGDYVDELVSGSPNWAGTYLVSYFSWDGAALVETNLIPSTSALFSIAAGDFDRDGRAEVVADRNGGNDLIVEDTGSGIAAQDAGVDYSMFPRTFDADGDAFPELLVDDFFTTTATFIIRDEVSNP